MMDDEKDLGLGIGDWGMEERTGNGVRPSGEVRAGMREVGKAGHQALEAGECRNGGVVLGAKSTKTQKRRRKEREEREYEGWDEPWKANSQKSRMLTGLQGELLGLGLEKKREREEDDHAAKGCSHRFHWHPANLERRAMPCREGATCE